MRKVNLVKHMERFVFQRIESMYLGMFSVTNTEYMRLGDLQREKYSDFADRLEAGEALPYAWPLLETS